MGQDWMVINLDKEERGGCWGKLGEFLFEGSLYRVVNMLTHPVPLEHSLASINYTTDHSLTGRLGHLQFPNEILDMIFAECDDLQDVACLSIANSHLLRLGINHAEELIKLRLWTGDRIMCMGAYTRSYDLPQRLLTQEQEQKLKEYMEREREDTEEYARSPYSFAESSYRRISIGREDISLFENERWKLYSLNRLEHDLLQCFTPPFHEDTGPYALCNLSKSEYVPDEAIDKLAESAASKNRWGLHGLIGIGEVLFTQICWSTDGSTATVYDGPIHRGAWAGDRIAIFRINEMPTVIQEGKEWKDVSERVLGEVEKIWKAERYL